MLNKISVEKLAVFTGHQHPVYTLEAAPETGRFFSAGGDKLIVSWDIHQPDNGTVIAKVPFTIYSLCCIPGSHMLMAGTSDGGIHIIDLHTNKEIKFIQVPREGIFDIRYSKEHALIAASTEKGTILLIDPVQFSVKHQLKLSDNKIRNMCFNASRPYLYAACTDKNVYVVDLASAEKVFQFTAHQWACNAIYYDPVNDLLVTGSKDAHLRIWDIKKQFELVKNVAAHNYAIYQIGFNPAKRLYATASRDKTIKIWDQQLNLLMRINKEKQEGHTNSVNAVLWLDDHHLISGSDDRSIIAWKVGI